VWCGGGTDPIELSTHADLTANTPYWLVIQRTSGASLGASNTVATRGYASAPIGPLRTRLYDGSNWNTTAVIRGGGHVIKVGTRYYGVPLSDGEPALKHIYSMRTSRNIIQGRK